MSRIIETRDESRGLRTSGDEAPRCQLESQERELDFRSFGSSLRPSTLDPRPFRKLSAFTLTELLVVITIIVILASLAGPMLNSALRGTDLIRGTDQVIGALSLAHQTAITKGKTVEVRFYSYINSESPGDTGQGHAIQAFSLDDNGNYTPLMKAQTLPNTIILATNSTLSPLMGYGVNSSPTYSIPRVGTSYTYASFQYYPGGLTSLAASSISSNACLTVVNATDMTGANAGTLPVNYATIVIDPYNGSMKTYRPHL